MRVVIVVQGGLVESVYSDVYPVDVEIIDCDTTDPDEHAGVFGMLELIHADENIARVY